MFKKVLISNRGEIAVRVITACREMGIEAVAIYSEPDKHSRHVHLADEAYQLEGQPAKVYLDGAQIVEIAKRCGAQAIHPGYGFLSENAEFAQACADAGIKFIGPKPEVIRRMGSKVESRRAMEAARVPVVPGTTDPVGEVEKVKELGTKYGYPIAIKASAGGGGRGLRVVRSDAEVEAALAGAQREGSSYFGNAEVYVEKYLDMPRHIEVQVIADEHGNVAHLFERDCSTQRRHQKLLEETPAMNLDAKVRKELLEAAVRGAASLGYTSAGTLEFLVAGDGFYFLEVNTRVQVEHPITEMITGIDIVKEQISIAAGNKLSFAQSDVVPRGHAIECRINAEDPSRNFMPSPGTVSRYSEPRLPWVRVDSACYEGYQILPFYDSLLAKLVNWGRTREEAIARTKLALRTYEIVGVSTTIPFHQAILEDSRFVEGRIHTTYVEAEFMKGFKPAATPSNVPPVPTALTAATSSYPASAASAAAATMQKQPDAMIGSGAGAQGKNGKDTGATERKGPYNFEVEVNQRKVRVAVTEIVDVASPASSRSGPGTRPSEVRAAAKQQSTGQSEIKAEMHGVIKAVSVKAGQKVQKGDRLMIVEAMKMESDVVAPCQGTVRDINVAPGETVESGQLLITIGIATS